MLSAAKLRTTAFQVFNHCIPVITFLWDNQKAPQLPASVSVSGLQCMIDAEQPYCADVDECNDERADFNKLDVRIFFSTAHNPLLFAALSVQPCISPSSCSSHCMKYSSIRLPICCRCAETTPTASTRWVRSAASARLDSTAGRQTADASISTSQISSSPSHSFANQLDVDAQVCEQHRNQLLRAEHALQQHDWKLHLRREELLRRTTGVSSK